MTAWVVHFDLRAPAFGSPAPQLYGAALDMAAWADGEGAAAVVLSEHHGCDDGYLPAALTMAAAVAARTRTTFVSVNALPLALHDPVAVAEQAAVVDLVAGGRLSLTVVPGYVPDEFARFGVPFADRGRIFEAKLERLVAAFAEQTTRSVQQPRPALLVGGSSRAAARRAARWADGFSPTSDDPALVDAYVAACDALGRPPGFVAVPPSPLFVHVAEDPDARWARLRPHAEHELASYRGWAADDPASPYAALADADAARAAGLWAVLSPDELAALVVERPATTIVLKPLLGGLDPAVGWASLELAVRTLRAAGT